MVRLLEMARDWALGGLAFGAVFLSAVVAGAGLFLLVMTALPKRPVDEDEGSA